MPHHDHEVEVFDAASGAHLGSATLADQASSEQIALLRRTRARKARRLQADLRAAERARRDRYGSSHPGVSGQRHRSLHSPASRFSARLDTLIPDG